MTAPRSTLAVDVEVEPSLDGVKKLGVAVSVVRSALEDGVKKLGVGVDVELGKPALPENDKPDAESENADAEAEAETVAFGTAKTEEKLPEAETETEALALLVLVRCPVLPGVEEAEAELCFARVDVRVAVNERTALDGVKKLGVNVAVSRTALALALEDGVKKLATSDVADVLTLTGALADADAESENEKGAFEDDAERKDPDADAEGVALALNDVLDNTDVLRVLGAPVVRVWRTVDTLFVPENTSDAVFVSTSDADSDVDVPTNDAVPNSESDADAETADTELLGVNAEADERLVL